MEEKTITPPDKPLKNLYSESRGCGRSEYISRYFFWFFSSLLREMSKYLLFPKSPFDEILAKLPFLMEPINLKFEIFFDKGVSIF
tara:strand:+ start:391 stop:645 length:255 start_codon:yes stop_codon:yes gene_type:complete